MSSTRNSCDQPNIREKPPSGVSHERVLQLVTSHKAVTSGFVTKTVSHKRFCTKKSWYNLDLLFRWTKFGQNLFLIRNRYRTCHKLYQDIAFDFKGKF